MSSKDVLNNMLTGAGYRVIFVPEITDDVLDIIFSDPHTYVNKLTYEEWKAQQEKGNQ